MKCQDVRRAFPLLIEGKIPLTEWALLETHLAGCAECRQELGKQRVEALQRARAKRRLGTAAGVATAVLLVGAGVGFYVYQSRLPEPPRPGLFRPPASTPAEAPPVTAAPVTPEPAPAAPAPAALVPRAPVATVPPVTPARDWVPEAVPPAAPRPKTAVETAPRPTGAPKASAAAPGVRSPGSPAADGMSADERMPTQAKPSTELNAAPGAEAMPTQSSARPASRGR